MKSRFHLFSTLSNSRLVQDVAKRMANGLLPRTCLACDSRIGDAGLVCSTCWSAIDFIEKPFCDVLGSPFAYDIGEGSLSAEAIAYPPAFDRLRAVALYRGTARKLVSSLKFSDRLDLAPAMADWMLRSSDGFLLDKPLIVPVPLHGRRLFSRRYNQAAELARHLAGRSKAHYAPHLIRRIRSTRSQIGLGMKERKRNVTGAFRVPADHRMELVDQRIVLIDDVYTTGATLSACARALRRAGARQIDCLTFARVAPGDI